MRTGARRGPAPPPALRRRAAPGRWRSRPEGAAGAGRGAGEGLKIPAKPKPNPMQQGRGAARGSRGEEYSRETFKSGLAPPTRAMPVAEAACAPRDTGICIDTNTTSTAATQPLPQERTWR